MFLPFIFKKIYNVIHPITFATELSRITTIHMGARYFKKKLYIFFLRNADERSTSSAIALNPTTRIIRIHVERAASGIIIELLRKSKKSKIDIPRIVTKLRTLNPSADAEPSASIITPIRRLQLLRLHPS